jgi:hypothetical protein
MKLGNACAWTGDPWQVSLLHCFFLFAVSSFLLEPRSRIRVTWDVFIMTCLLYLLMSMPYRIGFDVPGTKACVRL